MWLFAMFDFPVILNRIASSLAKVFAGKEKDLLLPDLLIPTTDEHR
jgi:hypothetical protein